MYFKEIPLSCIPLNGLMRSETNWWYDDSYMKVIRGTYAVVIPFISPLFVQRIHRKSIPRSGSLRPTRKHVFRNGQH